MTLKLSFEKETALAIARILAVAIPVILGVTAAPVLRAQSAEKFEVASVRRVEIPATDRGVPVFLPTGGIGTSDPGRITYHATWLIPLIAEAFGVRSDQVTGPAWLTRERYDIVANIPMAATKDQFNLMLGNLLIDRFRLRFHMDSTIRPIYMLRVGKNGPKVKQIKHSADDPTAAPGRIGALDPQGCPVLPPARQGIVGLGTGPGEMCWTGQAVPMADIVRFIEGEGAGRPIVDETGLTGRYDFKIHLQTVNRAPTPGAAPDPAPTVFNSVEEQLGLKLESATHSFPQLIIDSIEREPTEN